MMRLDGKTALVSGGAKGIGRGIAEVLCRAGANVFICDIDETEGSLAAEEVAGASGNAIFVRTDVAKADEVKEFVDTAVTKTGRIDVVCNNASYTAGPQHDLLKASEDEWNNNILVGLLGTRNLTAASLPHMIEAGGGSVVVISSVQALGGCATSTAYTSVKAAQIGFVKSTANDYGRYNIRVNALCPGPIQVAYSPPPGSRAHQAQVERTMLGRTGTPYDIGYAVLYLSSEEASFITGAVLPVDGGWSAR